MKNLKWFLHNLKDRAQIVIHFTLWLALFYLVFTPFAVVARIFRGDILRLKFRKYSSLWVPVTYGQKKN